MNKYMLPKIRIFRNFYAIHNKKYSKTAMSLSLKFKIIYSFTSPSVATIKSAVAIEGL